MQHDFVGRLRIALPRVRFWIDEFLRTHSARAVRVSSTGYQRLPDYFPTDFLDRAKVVLVDRTTFPPVDEFGLPEFAALQSRLFDGITFRNTFFVRRDRQSEGLCFHELIHVAQWARLGVDNFLLAYGVGLAQSGYENSPLEQMAYGYQRMFESATLPRTPLVPLIEKATDDIWSHAQQALES